MVSVFDFNDNFRDYVKKVMEERQLSYRALASKVGVDVRMIHDIVNKSKHLSLTNALKFSSALKHNKNEKEYFVQLVHLTQSKNKVETDFCRDQMQKIKSEADDSHPVIVDKYEYYSTLHHSVIRSLVVLSSFKDDYERLGNSLTPPISAEEAKQSIQLLERLGLIRKNKNGDYHLNNVNILANISSEGKKRFHRECSEIIKKQIFYCYPNDCQINNATLAMSGKTYKIVCDELRTLYEKLFKLVKNDKQADRVYQCQLAIVPLSITINSE